MYYYLEDAGLENPWESDAAHVIASGDDTVAWVAPELAERVRRSILKLTSRSSTDCEVGLG